MRPASSSSRMVRSDRIMRVEASCCAARCHASSPPARIVCKPSHSVGKVVSDMSGLTLQEASLVTGWSARMLRYIEESGLVVPARSPGGYRLFGPAELQRLRTLRELLEAPGVELAEVG